MKISELNFDNNKPIYLQIAKYFQTKIFIGEAGPGDIIPSRRELAAEAKVNLNTVQKAYSFMEEIGLIKTEKNRFSSITNDLSVIENLKKEFVEETLKHFVFDMKSIKISKEETLKLVEIEFDKEANKNT